MPDFDNLFEIHYPKIYGYFFRRVNNQVDVEDLTMITIANFFEVLKTKELQKPENYLWKIAHNQLVTFYNFNTKQKMTIGFEDTEQFEKIVDSTFENKRSPYFTLRLETLLLCMQKHLPNQDYNLVQASIFEGKNSTEFSLKADNIRQKLHRIFKKTKEKCKKIWN